MTCQLRATVSSFCLPEQAAPVVVGVVFATVDHADIRGSKPRQSRTDLFLLHGLPQMRFRFHVHPPFGIKPGTPVFTTSFSLCLV